MSEKFIAWAKVVQRAGSFFVLAKILSLGREYLIAWAKNLSPRRKHSREHTCSRGFLAWANVASLERNYFLAWAKTVQRAYLLLKTILAWARCYRLSELCRKHKLSDNLCSFYYHRATTHVSDD